MNEEKNRKSGAAVSFYLGVAAAILLAGLYLGCSLGKFKWTGQPAAEASIPRGQVIETVMIKNTPMEMGSWLVLVKVVNGKEWWIYKTQHEVPPGLVIFDGTNFNSYPPPAGTDGAQKH